MHVEHVFDTAKLQYFVTRSETRIFSSYRISFKLLYFCRITSLGKILNYFQSIDTLRQELDSNWRIRTTVFAKFHCANSRRGIMSVNALFCESLCGACIFSCLHTTHHPLFAQWSQWAEPQVCAFYYPTRLRRVGLWNILCCNSYYAVTSTLSTFLQCICMYV